MAAERLFVTGQTSDGHYQIELACDACHTEPFGGGTVRQVACIKCHGEELKSAGDSHPKRLFTDPRNADRVAAIPPLPSTLLTEIPPRPPRGR